MLNSFIIEPEENIAEITIIISILNFKIVFWPIRCL